MAIDPELLSLRKALDAIDQRLLELLAERVRVVLEVGEYKRARGLRAYDPERERQMIERLCDSPPAPLDAGTIRRIFERVIDESRRLEQRHIDE